MPARVGRPSPSRHILANNITLATTAPYLCPDQFMPLASALQINISFVCSQNGTGTIWWIDPSGTMRQVTTQAVVANTQAVLRLNDNIGPLMVHFVPSAAPCTLSIEASYSGGMTQ